MYTITHSLQSPSHYSYVEKKSEFIANACHIHSLEEAKDFIESIRQAHPKARHVCYAAIVGITSGQLHEIMSDDGEPSGTAGKPILNVLRHSNITDTVVVVTRYFGGILLGAGGLVRAYSTSASEVLKASEKKEVIPAVKISCEVQYSHYAVIERVVRDFKGEIVTQDFTDKVRVEFLVPQEQADNVKQTIVHNVQTAITFIPTGNATLIQGSEQ